jgi:hypothetical protein
MLPVLRPFSLPHFVSLFFFGEPSARARSRGANSILRTREPVLFAALHTSHVVKAGTANAG